MRFLFILLFITKNTRCIDCMKFGPNCLECTEEKCILCDDYYGIDTNPMSENYKKCVLCKGIINVTPLCLKCNNNYEICEYCKDGYGINKDETSEMFNTCFPCDQFYCKRCNYDLKKCIECHSNHGKDVDQSTPDNLVCKPCRGRCDICTNDANKCEKCQDGTGLNHGGTISTDQFICLSCNSIGCTNCREDYMKCNSCKLNYHFNESTKLCDRCKDNNCLDCSENQYNCSKCSGGYGLVLNELTNTYSCQLCSPNCDECFNSTCLKCKNGYGLDLGACVSCKNFGCIKCSVNASICEQCNENYFIDENENSFTYGKCVKCEKKCNSCYNDEICYNCSEGYGVDEYGKCVKCEDPNCIYCGTNYTICTKCKIDFGINENKCIECDRCDYCYKDKAYFCSECPDGYGGNDCQKCTDENCIHCPRFLDKCTKCVNNYEISYDNCVKVPFEHCNEYKYNKCTKCEDGYWLVDYDFLCVKNDTIPNCVKYLASFYCSECKDGYGTFNNEQCIKCADPHCKKCDINQSICTSCEEPYYITKEKTCAICDLDFCKECNDYSNTCNKCYDGFIAYDGKCVPCTENCLSCWSDTSCKKCKSGYCVQDHKCVQTSFHCSECYSNGNCMSCETGYYLKDGECYKCQDENCDYCIESRCFECLLGYSFDYSQGTSNYGKCVKCEVDNCESCTSHPKICDNCVDGTKLIDNECIGEPSGLTIPPTKTPTPSSTPLPTSTIFQYKDGENAETTKKLSKNDIYGIIISAVFIFIIVTFIIVYFILKKVIKA